MNKRALKDALLTFGGAVAAYLIALELDLFEVFNEFSREHEEWQLDELAVLAVVLGFGLVAFGVRRITDQRREIVRRIAAENQARELALHDPLTGLPNRRCLVESLRQMLIDLGPDEALAVFMLDLNRFKAVNDLYGHAAGDELLIAIAQRLHPLVGSGLMARIGGDEFVVALPGLKDPDEAARFAVRVLKELEQPVIAEGTAHRVGVGIGIAVAPGDGRTTTDLLSRADHALYRAKRSGFLASCFFEPGMDAEMRTRAELERDLRAAIGTPALRPNYQPVVDLDTGAILGFEALARWTHPTRGEIEPARFVPIAEDSAQIGALSEHLFRTACADASAWPAHVWLSFNISPAELRERSLGLRLLAVMAETGLSPNRLVIEITEDALVRDIKAAAEVLSALRSAGVRIALDDFGTGHASLFHLRELEIDHLKIDRSFVQHVSDDAETAKIVRAIFALGDGLGLTVTAEGVETEAQRRELAAQGCRQAQGYLFGRPIPARQALSAVEARAMTEARQRA